MRYLEGTDPAETAFAGSHGILVGTAIYGLLLGVGFLVFGLKRRELWMAFWGALLGLSSLAYLGTRLLGFA